MTADRRTDARLLNRALRLGRLRTKTETVRVALQEFIQRREQRKILKAMGTFEFRDDWDYKQDRRASDHRR
jgi:hypothetical protein